VPKFPKFQTSLTIKKREVAMAADTYTSVTYTSWGQRIKESFKSILFGLILFIVGFPLLFWNEGRTVQRYKALKEGESAVITVESQRIDPANDAQLVHLAGHVAAEDLLKDNQFNVSANVIKLKRVVEMYQWEENRRTETQKTSGGGEKKVTRYSYSQTWSASLIRSSSFKHRSGHENPAAFPFQSRQWTAQNITVDAFSLSRPLVDELDQYDPLIIEASGAIPSILGSQGKLHAGGYYCGQSPESPQIGDVRVKFKVVRPGTVSFVAQQKSGHLQPYHAKAGSSVALVQFGHHSATDMFKRAHLHNRVLSWGLRVGGWFLIFIGLLVIFKPLPVVADILPLIGRLFGAGIGMLAFLLSLVFALSTMGIAWVYYRPLLGIPLLVGALILFILALLRGRGRKSSPPAAPARQPAPQPSGTPPGPPPPPPKG
jgi:hypothetical protein